MTRWSGDAKLSKQAIDADRWDLAEFKGATKGLRPYGRARKKLRDFAATGDDALADAFWALSKANPQLLSPEQVQPTHLVNRVVAREMLALPSTRRLREYTVGDALQAAQGCVTLEPMLETIFDRLSLEQDLAEELQAQLAQLIELRKELSDAEESFDAELDPDELDRALKAADDLRQRRQEISDLEAELDTKAQDLADRLDEESPGIRSEMRQAIGAAADEAASLDEAARAWGLGRAELRLLSPAERLKLAQKLNQEHMREVAELFGRIKSLTLYDPAETLDSSHDEIVDLELGGDLGRVVPSELLLLGDADTELDFMARLSDGELLQYSVQGTDELGRGGIVMCIDCSGSMHGPPEMWCKAVMLVLLHQARAQGRTMHVIHFGSPGQTKHDAFLRPADFTAERIFEAAAAFYGGGTDFQTPMSQALTILADEFAQAGGTRADVVFATDDECSVRPTFMEHYLAEMHRMGARTYGLAMAGYPPSAHGPLMQMSEGRVASISDLRSGRDIRPILRSLR